MTALVDALKKTGLKKLSMKELEDFLYFYSENEDKSCLSAAEEYQREYYRDCYANGIRRRTILLAYI